MSTTVTTIAELTDIIRPHLGGLTDAVNQLHGQIEVAQETGILDDMAATWMTEQSQTIIGHSQRMMEHFGNLDPEADPENHRRLAFRSERLLEEALTLHNNTELSNHSGVVRAGTQLLEHAQYLAATIDNYTRTPEE